MQLNFRQYSSVGDPLIILHGLFGSLKNWSWQARQLAEHFTVYGLDLRNHGESPHADEMSYPTMADDVLQFLDEHSVNQVRVLGHSMGGKVAMQLAGAYPDYVHSLVVADIAPVAYDPSRGDHENIFTALTTLDIKHLNSRGEADEKLAVMIADPAVRQFLAANLVRSDEQGFCWRFNLSVLENEYDKLRAAPEINHPYPGPVLFIRGEYSSYVQEADREKILQLFPAAKVKTVAGAGHWLHAEQPQMVNNLVQNFFSNQSR